MSLKTDGIINYIHSTSVNKSVIICGNFKKVNTTVDARGLALMDENFNFYGAEFFQMTDEKNNRFVDSANPTYRINVVEFFDNNTKLIVAGKFLYIGNIYANNIAIYDFITQEWSPLGKIESTNNGTNDEILAIKYFDNKIVVGGKFINANDYPGTNFENEISCLEDNISTLYVALYNLANRQWYQLKGNNYVDTFVPGVNNYVYALDVIQTANSYEIYVGGKFTGVNTHNIQGIIPKTKLFAKFILRSLTNHNLNVWESVLDLENLFVNISQTYYPYIKFINASKGYLAGHFCGTFNNIQVSNALRYNGQTILNVGQNLELTIKNQGCYSGEVNEIKFFDNNNAFICGNFTNATNSDNLVKYNQTTNTISSVDQQTDNYKNIINSMTWINSGSGTNKVGRLFIANSTNTTNKLIYNMDLGNNNIVSSWSYSFYDILDRSVNNTINLKKYLTESVYNFNSFQNSEYNIQIKPYLRLNYDKFEKINNIVQPELVEFDKLDSLLKNYSDDFEGSNNGKILFCLLKETKNIVNLNGYSAMFPITCYMSLINGEKLNLTINGNNYLLDYVDNQNCNKRIYYNSDSAGLNEKLVFKPTRDDTLVVLGVGSLLSDIHCLTPDTRVLTPRGYKLITELKRNDYVITSDMRKVKIIDIIMRSYKPNKFNYPYLVPKNSIAKNYPPSDIKLSGGHLIKYGEKWIHPANSGLFKQIISKEDILYYHIQLENYETDNLVINEGGVVESYFDNKYFAKVQSDRLNKININEKKNIL